MTQQLSQRRFLSNSYTFTCNMQYCKAYMSFAFVYLCIQKNFLECSESETYRIKNKHPTEQMDSFMSGLIGKVVQSGKSRLQDKTGQLIYIGQKHTLQFPTPQTLREMGTSSQHNNFWDCLSGHLFLMIG